MKSYRDLEIYKESKRLAIQVHAMSLELPKFELYEEGSQIRRSSKAVTSMIHPEFLFETGSSKDQVKIDTLKPDYDTLSKRINKFIQWVEESFISNSKNPEPKLPATGNWEHKL